MEMLEFIEKKKQQPHLFILGAGATAATIPNGDRNGKKSPVMEDFLNQTGLQNIISGIKLKTKSKNIEAIYSELYEAKENHDVIAKLEGAIVDYYQNLKLPDNPTLYDYLVLSLRSKDCIATFNWDPLLIQAYNRVNKITSDLPELLFLHGCVNVGVCEKCSYVEPLQNKRCSKCGSRLVMPKLLYPVKSKDYTSNIYIRHAWQRLELYLRSSCLLTIWGYGAPESDAKAKEVMLMAFSSVSKRFDNIEIIDIANDDIIQQKWGEFFEQTNYHASISKSLLENTYISEFPRRSVEGYVKRNIEEWWNGSTLEIKECLTFSELAEHFRPLLQNESNNDFSVI